tara:strand:- start:28229 stop:28690 length:462 start_codon:yes stop_codon:yes gene_type:complete
MTIEEIEQLLIINGENQTKEEIQGKINNFLKNGRHQQAQLLELKLNMATQRIYPIPSIKRVKSSTKRSNQAELSYFGDYIMSVFPEQSKKEIADFFEISYRTFMVQLLKEWRKVSKQLQAKFLVGLLKKQIAPTFLQIETILICTEKWGIDKE